MTDSSEAPEAQGCPDRRLRASVQSPLPKLPALEALKGKAPIFGVASRLGDWLQLEGRFSKSTNAIVLLLR